jgi:hypothetical protein
VFAALRMVWRRLGPLRTIGCAPLLLAAATHLCAQDGSREPGSSDPPAFVEVLCRTLERPVLDVPIEFAVPLARGRHVHPPRVRIADRAAVNVQAHRFWPDRSLRVVLVTATVDLPADASRVRVPLVVEEGEADAAAPAALSVEDPWLAAGPERWLCELEDPWGRSFAAKPGRTSVAVASIEWSGAFARDGAELLTVCLRLDHLPGDRAGVLTMSAANRGEGAAPVPGPIRFRRLSLFVPPAVRLVPRFADHNLLAPPVPAGERGYRQDLLGPSDGIYLGDRTAKTWRFDVFLDAAEPGAAPLVDTTGLQHAKDVVALGARARVDLESWRRTGAFGVFGGPAPIRDAGAEARATARGLESWRRTAAFGPFGGFGDPVDAAAPGAARVGPSSLHELLRQDAIELWWAAEEIALQQTLRPDPVALAPRLPDATAAWRQGLGERALAQPHGFTAPGYEHMSVGLLADWHLLTGDPVALAELRRFARAIPQILASPEFRTCRGEGRCLLAGVRVADALGGSLDPADRERSEALLEGLGDHVRSVLAPLVEASRGRPAILSQPPHPRVLDGRTRFDSPPQMAELAVALAALHLATGDPVVADLVLEIAQRVLDVAIDPDEGVCAYVAATDPTVRGYPARIDSLSSERPLVCAFVVASELATERTQREAFEEAARRLVDWIAAPRGVEALAVAPDRWLAPWFDRFGIPTGELPAADGVDTRTGGESSEPEPTDTPGGG